MTTRTELPDDFSRLLVELVDGRLSAADAARLRQLLRDDDALDEYVRYMGLHSLLEWRFATPGEGHEDIDAYRNSDAAAAAVRTGPAAGPSADREQALHGQEALHGYRLSAIDEPDEPELLPAPSIPRPEPELRSGRWSPFRIAALATAAAVLAAAGVTTAVLLRPSVAPALIAAAPTPAPAPAPQPAAAWFVATVVSAVGAEWAEPLRDETTSNEARLRAGRHLRLTRGFAELAFDGGARVIFEAPSEFTVDSSTEMSLAHGRVTATAAGPARGFVVRTAAADVTDLGTQFGVASDAAGGGTQVHVFAGEVRATPRAAADAAAADDILPAPQAGSLLKAGDAARMTPTSVSVMPGGASPQAFVRDITGDPRVLDVVDLINGGDGATRRRGLSIDPSTGRAGAFAPGNYLPVDAAYRRVAGVPVIDGAFVPQGTGPDTVDSAGHAFQFAISDRRTFQHIRTGGTIEWPADRANENFTARLGGVDYGSDGHGVILLHSNKGLTLDLAAVRRLRPATSVVRFRCVVGSTYAGPETKKADAFVIVDGKARYERRGFTNFDGPGVIDVALAPTDRFLTLASTDGGDTTGLDWIIFGDPQFDIGGR